MPIVDELVAMQYLGIDYSDDVTVLNVTRALKTAVEILHGAVGPDVEDLMPDDPRVKELVLIYMDDLFSNRGVSMKVSGAVRRCVHDMELQLQMELRRKREEASV